MEERHALAQALTAATVHVLTPGDVPLMHAALSLFANAFDDAATYTGAQPSADYLERLLGLTGGKASRPR